MASPFSVGTYAAMNGIIYCKAHFKQLFKLKANHDKGVRRKWHSSKNIYIRSALL